MRLRMLKTASGSRRGFDPPERHEEGRVYDLPDGLARIYLEAGWACLEKAHDAAPANKAHGAAQDDKARRAVHLGFGRWAVVDGKGRRLNARPLSKAEARALAGES